MDYFDTRWQAVITTVSGEGGVACFHEWAGAACYQEMCNLAPSPAKRFHITVI